VGGPYIGGNFWAHPNSTGFSETSQTCPDNDHDFICDDIYELESGDIDYLPLKKPASKTITGCDTIGLPGAYTLTVDIIDSIATSCIGIVSSDVILDGDGHTIDGVDDPWSYGGVYVHNPSMTLTNVTVRNLKVTDWAIGIYYYNETDGNIENNFVHSNWEGIRIQETSRNTITGNHITMNDIGIEIPGSTPGNLIYNNYFNNEFWNVDFNCDDCGNYWNASYDRGNPNIMGGPYMGGNYWAYPDGTGFSETCTDSDGDYICDSSHPLYSNNTDYLPLAKGTIGFCMDITSPGYYLVGKDIVDSSEEVCINITSSDVILDGGMQEWPYRRLIDGIGGFGTYGVYVYNPSTRLTNVTVKNLRVKNWAHGIYYKNTDHSYIENIEATSNRGGVFLSYSDGNVLTENNMSSNEFDGIRLEQSHHTTILSNWPSYNQYGITLYQSNYNNITSNEAMGYDNSSSYAGIHLKQSNNNSVTENYVESYWVFGIYLTYSSNNTISYNDVHWQGRGIELDHAPNNTIAHNTIIANKIGLIVGSNSGNNDIMNNIVDGNYQGITLGGGNTLSGNTITNNYNPNTYTGTGLELWSGGNTIYNNFFDNYRNVEIHKNDLGYYPRNAWNISQTPGINILGRRKYIGGNY